jgi:glycosyltransferase involved in cell wall biosynthesis
LRLGDIAKMVADPIGVIQILPELIAGGVERGTLELSRFLVQEGHRSLVISRGGPLVAQLLKEGGRHLQMPYIGEKSPRCLLHLWPLRRVLQRREFHVVHLRSRLPAWIAYLAWKSLPVPRRPALVTTFHGFYSINAYSAVMTRGQRVIAISRVVADHIQRHYGTPRRKIRVIHRGIDPDYFHPDRVGPERITRIQRKWESDDQVPVIMLPGRVTRWKGHAVFIRALARIRDIPWRAVCVGPFDARGAFFRELRGLVDASSLSDVVRFPGHEGDMPAAYAAADLVVSAATDEPEAFGRVSIEAQAMGRPIIASAHGGSLETVLDGRTGWLFAPGDADGLARVIRKALSLPDLGRQLGRAGFLHVHDRFTTRQMCLDTLEQYRQLLP